MKTLRMNLDEAERAYQEAVSADRSVSMAR